jgi:hypothetical protein
MEFSADTFFAGQGESAMLRSSDSELRPRNGHTLTVGNVCRISGCENQKELSLEDQEDNAKETVKDLYNGPAEIDVIAATIAKGEHLDRPELEQIERAILEAI